jgi:hypothetical protein
MKPHVLISQLELAKRTFADDPRLGASHLSAALRALQVVSVNNPETSLTHADWNHVVSICVSLDPVVTAFGSRDALRELDHIHYQATQWRDR